MWFNIYDTSLLDVVNIYRVNGVFPVDTNLPIIFTTVSPSVGFDTFSRVTRGNERTVELSRFTFSTPTVKI